MADSSIAAPTENKSSPGSLRARAAAVLVMILFLLGAGGLVVQLTGRLADWQAGRYLIEDRPDLAWPVLKTAAHRLSGDDRVWTRLGEAGDRLSRRTESVPQAYDWARKAKTAYRTAQALNPREPNIAYGLARVERQMERLHLRLFPRRENPHDPAPYFQQALALRPNGLTYRYELVRYLFAKRKMDELTVQLRLIAARHPRAFHYLKKEPFWIDPFRQAVRQGLGQAAASGIDPRNAHMALSAIAAEDDRWDDAVAAYEKGLGHRSFENKPTHQIHRGDLYLAAGRVEAARLAFVQGLDRSRQRSEDLERIFNIHRRLDRVADCSAFLDTVAARYGDLPAVTVLRARCLYELQRYEEARQVLSRVLAVAPYAEAWYWSARIAQRLKDWDTMELSAQKATVADPEHHRYHLLFSQALRQQKKYPQAEAAATEALRSAEKPAAWMFNYRAWIRWARRDWAGAARDWRRAIDLSPERAPYYAHLAEAYGKMGDADLRRNFYREALSRDPGNRRYRERYEKLLGNR